MERTTITIKGQAQHIDICCGSGMLAKLPQILHGQKIKRIFVICNETVWKYWGKYLHAIIGKQFSYGLYLLPDGEKYKNLDSMKKIYNALVKAGATRTTALIAVGGGVIGDMAGFAAATYHRGMPLVHIPTTLLAMVDSSIGGKTGVNLPEGKNLVGSFYQPLLILTDIDFLKTLPEDEYISGMAEIIKAGLIRNKRLFEYLENNRDAILKRDQQTLLSMVKMAQAIKIDVVQRDEKESGLRAILNFGHTLGHAVEKLKNWKILHGNAVAIGMGFAAYASYRKGYITEQKLSRILNLISGFGLPLRFTHNAKEAIRIMGIDKKKKDTHIEWVLIKDIGKSAFGQDLEENQISAYLHDYRQIKNCYKIV